MVDSYGQVWKIFKKKLKLKKHGLTWLKTDFKHNFLFFLKMKVCKMNWSGLVFEIRENFGTEYNK